MHGMADVLHRLLAAVGEGERQLVADLVMDGAGDGDAARLGQRLEPRRDIDTVAENVAALDDDVAEIYADAEFEAAVGQNLGIARRHRALNGGGAADGGDHALELGQEAVAGGLDQAALMRGDHGLEHRAAMRVERAQRADLVAAHEPAIAHHVGHHDGGEPALDDLAARTGRRHHAFSTKASITILSPATSKLIESLLSSTPRTVP